MPTRSDVRTPRLRSAVDLLTSRRPREALVLAEAEALAAPGLEAFEIVAECRRLLGDIAGAAEALGRANAFEKRSPERRAAQGMLLAQIGDAVGAERAFRKALEINRRCLPAARDLSLLLCASGRFEEAVRILKPLMLAEVGDEALRSAFAEALTGAGRRSEALEIRRRILVDFPKSAVAEHNLAALLGDLGRPTEARLAAERAHAKGLEAPETHLVRGRALAALGEHDAAESAFRRVLAERPFWSEAHRELAQLIWTRTGERDEALGLLRTTLLRPEASAELRRLLARALTAVGDPDAAIETLLEASHRHPSAPELAIDAANALAMAGRPQEAQAEAERARTLNGDQDAVDGALTVAFLGLGEAKKALALAEAMTARRPHSQHAIAYLATAARLCDDARYKQLYAYEDFVGIADIEAPSGWVSRQAYLLDLATALNAAHSAKTHPFDQSVRHGSQLPALFEREEAPIRSLPQALAPAIEAFIEKIGQGRDAFRRRNVGGYSVVGSWSVRLQGRGGRHVNHVHQEGWISSAFYVDLPKTVEEAGQPGWIAFGEPGVPTAPTLAAERTVRPERGRLVLFPSYMWHGTTPFDEGETRLTVAFDLRPKPRGAR